MSENVELLEEQKSQDDDQQRDPALDWFLTHCHLHKYPAKSTLIHAGEDAKVKRVYLMKVRNVLLG